MSTFSRGKPNTSTAKLSTASAALASYNASIFFPFLKTKVRFFIHTCVGSGDPVLPQNPGWFQPMTEYPASSGVVSMPIS